MSKKQLLSEGEIRRFMKYANLGPLTENFLSETGVDEAVYEEEEMGGEMSAEEPAPAAEEPAPAAEDVTVDDDRLMDMITQAVEAALAKAGLGGGGEEDMGGEIDMPEEEEEEEEGVQPMDEEQIVSEVARRVMRRLSESRKPARAPARRSRADAINEVTNRIMKRILKSK